MVDATRFQFLDCRPRSVRSLKLWLCNQVFRLPI
jgi:hypothetical protein